MRRGYIRLSKAGPSLEDQQRALASAGVGDFGELGPVYVDEILKRRSSEHLPRRAAAIRSLFEGDELVIASAAQLGTSAADVLAALEAISRKGATVYDIEAREAVTWHPDALKVIAFAQRAESGNRKDVARKARVARAESGRIGGAPSKLEGRRLVEAKKLWADPELSAGEIADRMGVSRNTLYRLLGERGTPRFGRSSN
jgi:DNA invertase Pin-like site-specific DNA recombinase